MNNVNVKIELIQGDNSPVTVTTELTENLKNLEVAGTLAFRILKLRQKASKYKMNLGGFSFARKFDVKISIGSVSASGTQSIGMNTLKFGITIQNTEKSADKFHEFITDLVNDMLTGDSELEGEFEELKEELVFKEVQLN